MQLEQGDTFEATHAEWIRSNLPFYEPVWSAFIGHNGKGMPCPIAGLDESSEKDRKHFYQAHYSFVCKMHAIQACAAKNNETLGQAKDCNSFEAELNRLFCLMASVGYIHDMFRIMDDSLSANGDLSSPLHLFYTQRNHILHGPRVPVRRTADGFMIPRIGGENKLSDEWDDKSTWDSIPENNFILLVEYAEKLTSDLFHVVNCVHGKVFNAACKRFGNKRITEPIISSTSPPPSGVTDFV